MKNAMCAKKYFEHIIDLYVNARECNFKEESIYRGRGKSISSNAEELTAYYINSKLNNNCNYFVDQPIKMGNSTRYPDIVMQQKDGIIKHLFDVKTDTGWFRNGMLEFCKKWDGIIESVKNDHTTFKRGLDKKTLNGQFSDSLKFHIIVITKINSGKKLLNDYDEINSLNNINLYILSGERHPNTYNRTKDEIINDIKIHYCEFNRLLDNIK